MIAKEDHKCLSCKKIFPVCGAVAIIWGIDMDESLEDTELADLVVECDAFEERVQE